MKYFFISAFFLSAVAAQAQIAYWAVQPKYDQVKTDESGALVISTKKDSTFLWNDEGRLLAKTTMQVYPFREGKAVAVMPRTNLLKGFYTQEGKFIAIEYGNVANSAPYFSSGHLLVEQDGVYRYINGKGSLLYNRCESAFPFKNGFAACREYEDGTKKKGAHYAYIAADGSPVTLAYGGKTFDGGDIDYLSSVNDEGLGVVVAKGKLFLFEAKRKALRPLCVDEADSRQATVDGRVGDFLREANSYTYALHAKADEVVVELNLSHQPTAIVRGGQRTEYKQAEKKTVGAETDYALTTTGTSSIGLALNGEELLPPQFESVRPVADDKAVVMKDGKWGLIKVDEKRHFRLSVNKGMEVGFRHHVFDTNIRVDLPPYISSMHTTLLADKEGGCLIDKRSWDGNDSESGNYVEYDCRLNIPAALADEVTTVTYPVTVQYDGILSRVIDMPVKAWHVRYYTVDIAEADAKLSGGTYTFVINIDKDPIPGEMDYPFSVSVDAKGLKYDLTKVSETRWRCKLLSLKPGLNTVNVQIMEQGCPPKTYPFEVTYQKPSPKAKNPSQQVKIEKRPSAGNRPAPQNQGGSNIKL